MTWTPYNSRGFESAKIWPRVVEYSHGVGLDIGCGGLKCLPHMIGVDKESANRPDVVTTAAELEIFADGSLDFIFSSHLLEHIEREVVAEVLRVWRSKLKPNGHLILYLPNSEDYPKVGEEGGNPDHKWDIYSGSIYAELEKYEGGFGWTQVEQEVRSEGNEYSIFEVYRKTETPLHIKLWERNPGGRKRAIVLRYGAIGDTLIAASVLPGLKAQGYHITFHCNEQGEELLRHHPMVDEIIVQTKEMVPANLGVAYYASIHNEGRYDLVVNLNHSLEGTCLGHKDFANQFWSHEARRRRFGRMSYLEAAHDIAGVPYDFEPTFHETKDEARWADEGRAAIGPMVLWQIAGSSVNKIYPFVDTVVRWLVGDGVVVVFTGGRGNDEKLERAIVETLFLNMIDTEMVAPRAGKWSIRKAIAMARRADCVIGPETGLLSAVALDDVPKVIYLSHSNAENLTKHWRNTTALAPDKKDCPCYPCHLIHDGWETCHEVKETKAALCASSIAPETIYEAVKAVLKEQTVQAAE